MIQCLKNNAWRTIRSITGADHKLWSNGLDFIILNKRCLVTSYINSSEWQNIMRGDTEAAENAECACSELRGPLQRCTQSLLHGRQSLASRLWCEQIIVATVGVFLMKSWSLEDLSDHNCHVYVVQFILYSLTVPVCVCVSARGCTRSSNPLNAIRPQKNSGFAVFKDIINFESH